MKHLAEQDSGVKAATDARYEELCRAWHILADWHEQALDRIEQSERLLALK